MKFKILAKISQKKVRKNPIFLNKFVKLYCASTLKEKKLDLNIQCYSTQKYLSFDTHVVSIG